jgi:asparagine synthase (glutamine-hydrolysing)
MIHKYRLHNQRIDIKSDLAAEFPIYIYLSDKRDYLLYSDSIDELLRSEEVVKPLEVRRESLSFLLQSGIVPLPNTIYENIFVVGIGDVAQVYTQDNEIKIDFEHTFPFLNKHREAQKSVSESTILELLAEATISRIDEKRPSYLFHSAGKDSNSIALALAEAGYQEKITFVTHRSKGVEDESVISKEIAKKLGFKHQTLYEPTQITQKEIDNLHFYFENIPFPCVDNVTLAYPLYAGEFNFSNTNIIDGSGNDVFMGHIPSKQELRKQEIFSKFHFLRPFSHFLNSNKIKKVLSTRSEWAGLSGINFGDTKKILEKAIDVYPYWAESDRRHKDWDYFDLRADIWGCMVESDKVMRKSRNIAHIYNANIIFPWTNANVAEYFSTLPASVMFNKDTLENKLVLRKMLKDRLGLDSTKIGKMPYSFDFFTILMLMKKEVFQEVLECQLWDRVAIEKVFTKLYKSAEIKGKDKVLAQRLYLISIWFNRNKYVKK